MDLSYGQNASKFGHADYYGNKAAGRSIKDIYDYVTRNQYVLAENNRFGGVDGLSDEIARDYRAYEAQEAQKQQAERARQEEQRRAQEASQRQIMEERSNLEVDVKQPNAESYIKLNFERPSYERDSSNVNVNQSTSPVNPFDSDIYGSSQKYTDSRSRYRPSRNQDDGGNSYDLNLRRNAKEKSSNWMKLQERRDQRAKSRPNFDYTQQERLVPKGYSFGQNQGDDESYIRSAY